MKTTQENFWIGKFGDNYTDRNSVKSISGRIAVFTKILDHITGISSIIEFGANIGQNILAIKTLLPECLFTGIEINLKAAKILRKIPLVDTHQISMFDFTPTKHDLSFTSGVLIHIDPDKLTEAYEKLYSCSRKYILIQEYYSPNPTEVKYRGHSGQLHKRDFAGEIMNKYPDLELIAYGFQYHRDNNFPLDDSTWFLMKKQ